VTYGAVAITLRSALRAARRATEPTEATEATEPIEATEPAEPAEPTASTGASRGYGNGQAFGLQVGPPSRDRNLVCCIMTGASAPCWGQPTWSCPSRCPTS
jgi:hypothetical protein